MEVSFAPEVIGHIGAFPITNSFLTSIVTSVFLVIFALVVQRKIRLVPSMVQNTAEIAVEGFYNLNTQIAGKRAGFIFPFFNKLIEFR